MILPKLHLELERWKWNPDYRVYISNFGNAKDSNKQEIKKLINQGTGYFIIPTEKGYKSVHRLVAQTWIGDSDLTVDHIDGNRRNNRLSNLEYVSKLENQERAKDMLVIAKPAKAKANKFTAKEDLSWFSEAQKYEPFKLPEGKRLGIGGGTFKNMQCAINVVKNGMGLNPEDVSDDEALRVINYIVDKKLLIGGCKPWRIK